MKIKTVILILLLFFIVVLIVVLRGQTVKKTDQLPPIQTFDQTQSNQNQNANFYIKNTNAQDKILAITEPFTVEFSQPITIDATFSSLYYQITPEINIVLALDDTGKILTVKPSPDWVYNTSYQFIIKKETTSRQGKTLNQDYVIKFQTESYGGI